MMVFVDYFSFCFRKLKAQTETGSSKNQERYTEFEAKVNTEVENKLNFIFSKISFDKKKSQPSFLWERSTHSESVVFSSLRISISPVKQVFCHLS